MHPLCKLLGKLLTEMMSLHDARGQDLVDLGALGRGENLQNEVEATRPQDGGVQPLGIIGGHEK
jgi:hypothetical protein